jgi:Cys-rich protein (TIGR01571 family)
MQEKFVEEQTIYLQPLQDQQRYVPPTGAFRDGLFNCFSNIWPSCFCVANFYGGGILPAFMAAQISHRIRFLSAKAIAASYIAVLLIFILIGLFVRVSLTSNITDAQAVAAANSEANEDMEWLFYAPSLGFLIFLVVLRLKFVDYFKIQESPLQTVAVGLCCASCSLCQMARHLFGYKRVLDGDGRLDGSMDYSNDQGSSENFA